MHPPYDVQIAPIGQGVVAELPLNHQLVHVVQEFQGKVSQGLVLDSIEFHLDCDVPVEQMVSHENVPQAIEGVVKVFKTRLGKADWEVQVPPLV